jgi:hypothetical protein
MNAEEILLSDRVGSLKHSLERCIERYGISVHPKILAREIFDGKAKLVSYGHFARLIYDVPICAEGIDEPVMIRCVYVPHPHLPGRILTVLPPKFRREIDAEISKRRWKNNAQRRAKEAQRFRQVNAEDDEEF